MRSNHLWLPSMAVAFLSVASAAQQPTTMSSGTSGGLTTIAVRVSYQQSHRPAASLHVELLSSYGGMVDMRTTDGNGGASFNAVSSGRYRVRISGPDIETKTSDLIEAGGAIGGPYINENLEVQLTKTAASETGGPAFAAVIPENAQKEFKQGSKEMDKKHYEEAKDHFQKAIGLFPKYADAFNNLALVQIQLKDAKSAVESFRSATQINPTLQQANLYLSQFYYENQQYKEAEPYLERAAADQPKNAQILTALANVELQNGETDLALTNARKVPSLENHKQFAISHLIVAQALAAKGQESEIAKEFEEYLKEAPDSPLAPRVKDELAKLKSK
ncbi:MAG TPA: tetratricopeptide repeat protein [Terriglobales bacterium]|nr:tetratricopeptide repeat protein [Terriglobales bacterium]